MREASFPLRDKLRHQEVRGSAGFLICVLVTLLMLYAATMLMQPRGLALTVVTDSIEIVLTCLATYVLLESGFRSRGPLRLFWNLFAARGTIFALAQIVWMYHNIVLGQDTSDSPVTDAVLFFSNIFVLAALLLQVRPRWWKDDRKSVLIDFGLLLAWWFYLYFYFVAPWRLVEYNEIRYDTNYGRLDALWSGVLLLLAAYLFKHASAKWRLFYGFYFGTKLLLGLSGYFTNQPIINHTYYPGSLYDLPNTIALASFTAVAIFGRSLVEEVSHGRKAGPFLLEKWGMASLLSLPVITGATLLLQHPPPRVAHFREVVVQGALLVVGALVFIRQQRMISELAKSSRALRQASFTDPLTGCANRRFLEAVLPADASLALRSHTTATNDKAHDLIFFLIDLDDFKEVNDRYGHSVGDSVLLEIVRRIKTVIRKSDVLVRWGGDEFLIVSRRSETASLAHRILRIVEAPIEGELVDSPIIRQTCSIGWAAYPWRQRQPQDTEVKSIIETIIRLADRALYQAKASGKNRAVAASGPGNPRET